MVPPCCCGIMDSGIHLFSQFLPNPALNLYYLPTFLIPPSLHLSALGFPGCRRLSLYFPLFVPMSPVTWRPENKQTVQVVALGTVKRGGFKFRAADRTNPGAAASAVAFEDGSGGRLAVQDRLWSEAAASARSDRRRARTWLESCGGLAGS